MQEQISELEPREIEFIRIYLVNGMNGTKAAMEAFGMNYNSASSKASKLLYDPRISAVLAAEMQGRMQRMRVDVDWVLEQAVEVFNRCMRVEKILDRNGELTGEFRFDAANSLKALDLIGKHVNVRAFEQVQTNHNQEKILERLQRARVRTGQARREALAALGIDEAPEESEAGESLPGLTQHPAEDSGAPAAPEGPFEEVNFLEPPEENEREPDEEPYEQSTRIIDATELTPEERHQALLDRLRNGR